MHYNGNDGKSYTYFVKIPGIEQKFAIGCKSLGLASIAHVIELAKDVAKRSEYNFTAEPLIYCLELDKIIGDDIALSFCISKAYTFEVVNGIPEANNKQRTAGRFSIPKLRFRKSTSSD